MTQHYKPGDLITHNERQFVMAHHGFRGAEGTSVK